MAPSIHEMTPDENPSMYQSERLLERIVALPNLREAYRRVVANRGAAGIDRMDVGQLHDYLADNIETLREQLLKGDYTPVPVRRVEIPKKEKGKVRRLGIPTVVDRMIQQAITQVLTPLFEPRFSKYSYGFRPKRSAHDALKQCQKNIDDDYTYVVDMDLERFFDTVCQSKLIQILSDTICDGRVVSLIHRYLRAGVMVEGVLEETRVGMPQGGPLSPLLSNIMLNELDRELERRGHRFVRYADDCMIFCKSRKAAERTQDSIITFIEKKLFLKVNRDKTSVAYFDQMRYLGYAFYRNRGCRLRVHPKSVAAMKDKVRELTARSNAWSNDFRPKAVTRFVRGWVNYFRLADMRGLLEQVDQWMRRRIRMVYWKQWKRIRTRYKMLRRCGIDRGQAWRWANSRKSYWRIAGSAIMSRALGTERLKKIGYLFFLEYYGEVRVR